MHPQFIAAGTKLYATGYPSENASLSCEAFGGLSIPGGLQLRLLRGPGLKELAEYNSLKSAQINRPPPPMARALLGTEPDVASTSSTSNFYGSSKYPASGADTTEENRLLDSRLAQQRLGDRIEIIRPGMDPRYHLTAGPDPKNPYAAQIRRRLFDKQAAEVWSACMKLPERAVRPTLQSLQLVNTSEYVFSSRKLLCYENCTGRPQPS
ncbi:unnamed protein product [Dibothriocephalus latus]|uniref:Uncharacterized protein n=1 Tax=Dibothriocephalus latus TaxID=60516 RepID=A0A3P6U6X2_DIBLA|nr:unnamed protein product [Dibothriocephalus latus]